jgi:hypothetical protein
MNCNNFTKKDIKEEIKKTIKEIQPPISITIIRKREARTNKDENTNKKSKVKITIDKIDLAKARTAKINWNTADQESMNKEKLNWFSLD